MKEPGIFKRPGETRTISLGGRWPILTFWEIVYWCEAMKTIRHTDTLVYYDGIQVFEGQDPIGGHYVGVMIDSLETSDVYLVTRVDPIQLRQFRSGTLDLKTLMLEGSKNGWYTTHTSDDLMQSLVLKVQKDPLAEKDFLPDDGFLLDETMEEDDLALPLPISTSVFPYPYQENYHQDSNGSK